MTSSEPEPNSISVAFAFPMRNVLVNTYRNRQRAKGENVAHCVCKSQLYFILQAR